MIYDRGMRGCDRGPERPRNRGPKAKPGPQDASKQTPANTFHPYYYICHSDCPDRSFPRHFHCPFCRDLNCLFQRCFSAPFSAQCCFSRPKGDWKACWTKGKAMRPPLMKVAHSRNSRRSIRTEEETRHPFHQEQVLCKYYQL